MTDLPRLRHAGSADDRALLAGAQVPTISEPARHQIRAALEERLSPRGRRRAAGRLALALAGTLLAGSALAYGVTRLQLRRALPSPAGAAGISGRAPDHRAAPPPPPARAPAAAPPATPPSPAAPARHRRTALRTGAPAPHPLPFGWPGLRDPADLLAGGPPEPEPDDSAAPAPPIAAPRLVINRPGRRPIALVLAGDRIVGKVRDSVVGLTISPSQISGKLGEHTVDLWLHGRYARGAVDGNPIHFELLDTTTGHALRVGRFLREASPVGSIRIVTTASSLSWSPGCDAPLTAVRPGLYQGRCARGTDTEVVIPPSWQQLPGLPRLILLSFFLSERDGDLEDLFGPPDWGAATE